MVEIEGNTSGLYIYNLNTKATKNMLKIDGTGAADQADNRNGFCSTIAALFAKADINELR
jgi:heterodisulfide reductase subunit A-like polyferredoxin